MTIPQGPYRYLYRHEGKLHPSGVTSYVNAVDMVKTGQAEAVVLDRTGWPQIYPNKGAANDSLRT